MKTIICDICQKEMEGYSDKHAEYILSRHLVKHRAKKEYKKGEENV